MILGSIDNIGNNMRLRRLELTDAEWMLEWMHTSDIVKDLQGNFASKTIEDCRKFIEFEQNDTRNLHLAIVNKHNQYMGTVSLKNINHGMAEFAIVVRKCAMGKGYAQFAINEIICKGFRELGLRRIYWCVSSKNIRAIAFYRKSGYKEIDIGSLTIEGYNAQQMREYLWFGVER